ncbi:MAG: polysaccharide deacetylase family protein [bacterium]
MSYQVLITIDVEDWFQVENFKRYIPFSSWSTYELCVEENTKFLLDLLDSVSFQKSTINSYTEKLRATFFVLGWIAERVPHLVKEIHLRGHEVASHGFNHNLCNECSPAELRSDLTNTKKLLEDIIGHRVYGYRAPGFSISHETMKIVEECGYSYDSSYNSFRGNKKYGQLILDRKQKNGIAYRINHDFFEIPISNLSFGKYALPWGGGGYFRVIPSCFFRRGVRYILTKDKTYLFYIHPWEINPQQPKVRQAGLFMKFKHYSNLNKAKSKLTQLIECFKEYRFLTCNAYLDAVRNH